MVQVMACSALMTLCTTESAGKRARSAESVFMLGRHHAYWHILYVLKVFCHLIELLFPYHATILEATKPWIGWSVRRLSWFALHIYIDVGLLLLIFLLGVYISSVKKKRKMRSFVFSFPPESFFFCIGSVGQNTHITHIITDTRVWIMFHRFIMPSHVQWCYKGILLLCPYNLATNGAPS